MLRTAGKEDLVQIAELECICFPDDPFDLNVLDQENEHGLTYIIGDPIYAYVLCSFSDYLIDVLRLGVHPAHRGRGHASTLLKAVFMLGTISCDQKASTVLTVRISNDPALHLYRKHGFRPFARLDADRIVMRRPNYISDAANDTAHD